jgi:methylated-DNA-[protein]-cysteine S-methyltransferase
MNARSANGADRLGRRLFDTAIGPVGIVWRGDSVCAVRIAGRAEFEDFAARHYPLADEGTAPGAVEDAARAMRALLGGAHVDLSFVAIDYGSLPARMVGALEACRAVPPGETRSYGDLARRLGDVAFAREVGQAMAANPAPIIVPCHRIVGEDGRLTGYSGPGGLETKRRLLAIEGAMPPDLFAAAD